MIIYVLTCSFVTQNCDGNRTRLTADGCLAVCHTLPGLFRIAGSMLLSVRSCVSLGSEVDLSSPR